MILNELKELVEPKVVGRALQILQFPYPRLTLNSTVVLDVKTNTELRQLIADMVVTVKTERALGLAAVQVGVPVRVMVLQNKEGTTTLINPITRDTQGKVYVEEGCLSLPHLYVKVPRAESVRVDYYDENAALQQKWFHSFESRAYQHEMDHLNGLVMLDRLSDYRRKEAEQKWAKLANKLAKG